MQPQETLPHSSLTFSFHCLSKLWLMSLFVFGVFLTLFTFWHESQCCYSFAFPFFRKNHYDRPLRPANGNWSGDFLFETFVSTLDRTLVTIQLSKMCVCKSVGREGVILEWMFVWRKLTSSCIWHVQCSHINLILIIHIIHLYFRATYFIWSCQADCACLGILSLGLCS